MVGKTNYQHLYTTPLHNISTQPLRNLYTNFTQPLRTLRPEVLWHAKASLFAHPLQAAAAAVHSVLGQEEDHGKDDEG